MWTRVVRLADQNISCRSFLYLDYNSRKTGGSIVMMWIGGWVTSVWPLCCWSQMNALSSIFQQGETVLCEWRPASLSPLGAAIIKSSKWQISLYTNIPQYVLFTVCLIQTICEREFIDTDTFIIVSMPIIWNVIYVGRLLFYKKASFQTLEMNISISRWQASHQLLHNHMEPLIFSAMHLKFKHNACMN